MATQTGTRTTFNSTVGLKIDLSDVRPYVVTPDDTPLLDRLNKKNPSINAVLHQWQEDSLVPSTDALTAMYSIGGGTITVTDFTVFKKGYVIRIEDELFRVSATPTTTTVTVSNGYAGTTNANHANGKTIYFVGYAVTDGADPEQFNTTDRSIKNNNIQVFQEAITVSDLEQWAQNYGIDDKYTYEVKKWLRTLNIRLELAVLKSVGVVDSTNNTRTMKGIEQFIATNVDSATTTLTEAKLLDQLQNCYSNGGTPKLIVVGPKQHRVITSFIPAAQKWYRMNDLGSMTAGGSVEVYDCEFGRMNILMDRNVPVNNLYILQEPDVSVIQGKPFTHELLAKTGTADKGEIVGWFSLELKGEAHMAKFTALT